MRPDEVVDIQCEHDTSILKLSNFHIKGMNFKFKAEWWPLLLWFFKLLGWSCKYSESDRTRPGAIFHSSFYELAIACDMLGKGGLGDHGMSLREKTAILQCAFERCHRRATIKNEGITMKYAKALLPSPNSHAIVGLGGGVVPGLLRRFVVQGANSDVNEMISLCLWRAKNFAAA